MSLDNASISELRHVAMDEATQPKTRLSSIDAIAAATNFWGTQRFPITGYVEPTTRGKKWLRFALRRLLKSKRPMAQRTASSIRCRLLMLKGIVPDFNNKILRPPLLPNGTEMPITPKAPEPVAAKEPERTVDKHFEELQAIIAQAKAIAAVERGDTDATK